MLEKMGDFFDSRIEGYEEHQLDCICSAREFYPFTASCLPQTPGARVLDLGCGTGLELGYYFELVPTAEITGIDLAKGMLAKLRAKFPEKQMDLILGSYFDTPFGKSVFDAAVSVESLHHFTKDEKTPLYAKLLKALKPGGEFILTDYFALSGEEERRCRAELLRLKKEQGLAENEFYHYDTPLTVAHETEALLEAGFASVSVLKSWGATYTLKAVKRDTMAMNKEDILSKLGKFKYGPEGFWLVTGAALVLYGVKEETSDIDMGCTSEAADRLEADGFLFKVMEDGNRQFKIDGDIEVFENWLCDKIETAEGYPVMSLKGIRETKLRLGREKDLRDIKLIDEFVSRI